MINKVEAYCGVVIEIALKRNTYRIVSKCDYKYEMDHDKWTTYRNFSNKYDHIIE